MGDNTFYEDLLHTALSCNIKIMSDDFCCKLLAWLYVFGGEICNQALLPLLKQRMHECSTYFNPVLHEWIAKIDDRYGIKTRRSYKEK
jgi:hypothetical protein